MNEQAIINRLDSIIQLLTEINERGKKDAAEAGENMDRFMNEWVEKQKDIFAQRELEHASMNTLMNTKKTQ